MCSPAIRIQEERVMHEAKLAKMEAEMKMVFQQKVQEKEAKLKQSEEELYARHREMKDALEKQRLELEEKKRRAEGGRPLTPEKTTVSLHYYPGIHHVTHCIPTTDKEEGLPSCLILDSVHGQLDVPFFSFLSDLDISVALLYPSYATVLSFYRARRCFRSPINDYLSP